MYSADSRRPRARLAIAAAAAGLTMLGFAQHAYAAWEVDYPVKEVWTYASGRVVIVFNNVPQGTTWLCSSFATVTFRATDPGRNQAFALATAALLTGKNLKVDY